MDHPNCLFLRPIKSSDHYVRPLYLLLVNAHPLDRAQRTNVDCRPVVDENLTEDHPGAFHCQVQGLVMSGAFRSHLFIRKGDDVEGGDIPHDVGKSVSRDAVRYMGLIKDLEEGVPVSLGGQNQ